MRYIKTNFFLANCHQEVKATSCKHGIEPTKGLTMNFKKVPFTQHKHMLLSKVHTGKIVSPTQNLTEMCF